MIIKEIEIAIKQVAHLGCDRGGNAFAFHFQKGTLHGMCAHERGAVGAGEAGNDGL